ncbi:septum formation initiator family protein [Leucobacter weissii]|uniref:Septum formation initiator family protein n=1 Tax=Leucobacter weissii TaxID=1983706 RepID=A0A939MSJ8_9MICO|nr:septum formation initiator family protein [Leucobacter weissii]MBO1902224.1 septum formation initiator family protein [Leucobacter weissii]
MPEEQGKQSAWVSSLRFSGFTVLIVALVAVGALIVSPTLSTYVQQQRELAELRESVRLHREAVAAADAERVKWQDPAYVRAQARGRLFYVMPGEIQLSVIEDVNVPAEREEETSDQLTAIDHNWARTLLASTLTAGTTLAEPEEILQGLLGSSPEAIPAEPGGDPAEGDPADQDSAVEEESE